jgi:hypothetical protein
MYRVYDFRRRHVRIVGNEDELLDLGYSAEEILTMLCGMHVRGCMIEMVDGLRIIDPCTLAEISDITGMKVPTVSGIVQRALKRLQRKGMLREFLHDLHRAREREKGEVVITIEGGRK